MASRTSTLIGVGKGALIYQNNTGATQLVGMNATSNSATVDVPITVMLDTSPSRTLNSDLILWQASQSRLVDIDIPSKGSMIITNAQNSGGILGNSAGMPLVTTSVNEARYAFQNYDPYMRIKPSEYGNATDNVMSFAYFRDANNTFQYRNNVLDLSASDFQSILSGSVGAIQDQSHNPSYYNRGAAFDHYTNTAIAINNNSYSEFICFCPGSNSVNSGNRSSDSFLYSALNGGHDPNSYWPQGSYANNFITPALQADGGVFTFYFRYPGDAYDALIILPAGRRVHNGTLPADKSSITSSGLVAAGNTANDQSTAGFSKFHLSRDHFQWMKYNKSNDTYYFRFLNGIYSWTYNNMTNTSNSQGSSGGGPWAADPYNFSGGSWQKAGTGPVGLMSIPAKIGQSLWVSWIGSIPYFSSDLISWSSRSSYLAANGVDADRLFVAEDATQTKYLVNAGGSVVQVSSGLDAMPQEGLLEKGAPIGAYERNGLILNPGDCLYAENGSQAASVSFTVTEVAI
jgi:hypothetical protein